MENYSEKLEKWIEENTPKPIPVSFQQLEDKIKKWIKKEKDHPRTLRIKRGDGILIIKRKIFCFRSRTIAIVKENGSFYLEFTKQGGVSFRPDEMVFIPLLKGDILFKDENWKRDFSYFVNEGQNTVIKLPEPVVSVPIFSSTFLSNPARKEVFASEIDEHLENYIAELKKSYERLKKHLYPQLFDLDPKP